jgi:hypothetical protein
MKYSKSILFIILIMLFVISLVTITGCNPSDQEKNQESSQDNDLGQDMDNSNDNNGVAGLFKKEPDYSKPPEFPKG